MSATVPLLLERDNVNDESVVLVRWFVRHGERVEADTLLAEIETSKANVEVYSPSAGFLVWSFPEGATIPVSAAIGQIAAVAPEREFRFAATRAAEDGAGAARGATDARAAANGVRGAHAVVVAEPEFPAATAYRQRISPLAAKMMAAHGLTAKDFAGISAVRRQDVLDVLTPPGPQPAASATGRPAAAKITQPFKAIALSRMKRREGQSLASGVGNAVQSAVSVVCTTLGLRRRIAETFVGGSASAVIVYEVSRLLRKYPAFNATFRDGAMLQYESVNVGYAMDDGRGLKVAVIHDCDALPLQEVSARMNDLTVAYIDDKITPAQIANATFTVSDMSGLGVAGFYPLISENQGAILGVGGEQFVPGSAAATFSLTLSFDHQLADGRTAALFLNDLKHRLAAYEAPETPVELACSQCGRTAAQVADLDGYLLISAQPKGYLCTLCAAGY